MLDYLSVNVLVFAIVFNRQVLEFLAIHLHRSGAKY
jgi:hypothetical protein